MGILFSDDDDEEDDNTYGDMQNLPGEFYIEDGSIYDFSGNKISVSYHEINFPKARLGAINYHLIEKMDFLSRVIERKMHGIDV
jgi:hypothetical protein